MVTRLYVAAIAGFLLGVFYASVFVLPAFLLPLVIAYAVLALAFSYGTRSRFLVCIGSTFFLCAFALGSTRFEAARIPVNPMLVQSIGEKVIVAGSVRSEPDKREGSTRLTVDVSSIDGVETSARVLVIAPPFTAVRYGDQVTIDGRLRAPESFESGEGRSFNYPMYLMVRGITHEVAYAQVRVDAHGGNSLMRTLIATKALYMRGLRAVLPEPYAGLAAGITAGDKRSVGSELSDTFQRVSLVHILVLSGYNITVVLGALLGIFAKLSRGPRLMAVLGIVALFIVIAGGAASAVRAGAMAFAAVYAQLYGRLFIALRVLIAVVCAMVIWNPLVLAYDPGFQLSVLATLGLVVFSPHIARVLTAIPERFQIREIVAATIATQLTVLPLLLFQNGMLSLVSLPANLCALIAVPFGMAASAVAAIAGIVFGTWGTVLALPAYIILRYIVAVADFFASIPYAAITVPAFSPFVLFCAYVALGCAAIYLERSVQNKNSRR